MQFTRFDLNLMRALDSLLEERNVTRAAERLFVTQQAMSGALRRLRDHFSDELLVRVGRHLELTPLAVSLMSPVHEALLQMQAALNSKPFFDPAIDSRPCRIAMSDYASLVLLPRFMQHLKREAPKIVCQVEGITEESFHKIDRGDLDFCLSASDWRLYANYKPTQKIRTELLFRDDFVCITDAKHPGVKKSMTMDLYRRLPHNTVRFGRGITSIVEQEWIAAGMELDICATVPSFAGLIFMLPGTRIVATAQRRLGLSLAKALGLRIFECPLKLPKLEENLVWHLRNEFDPGHMYLRTALKAAAVQLDGAGGPHGSLKV
jgi:LysR family nod box-dependent transcriptional activator